MKVTITFVGGPLEGQLSANADGANAVDGDAGIIVSVFYLQTQGGEVGRAAIIPHLGNRNGQMETSTTKASDGCRYRVEDRQETGGDIQLRAVFAPK